MLSCDSKHYNAKVVLRGEGEEENWGAMEKELCKAEQINFTLNTENKTLCLC